MVIICEPMHIINDKKDYTINLSFSTTISTATMKAIMCQLTLGSDMLSVTVSLKTNYVQYFQSKYSVPDTSGPLQTTVYQCGTSSCSIDSNYRNVLC